LLQHVVETYRDKIERLAYCDTFKNMLIRYEQLVAPADELSFTTVETEQTPNRPMLINGQRWQHALKDMDAEEEAYFNAEDNDDEDALSPSPAKPVANGASPLKPLVDYPDDDDEEIDLPGEEPIILNGDHEADDTVQQKTRDETPPPPERNAEKRRRVDDDEDELGKLSSPQPKRRTSSGNLPSSSEPSPAPTHTHMLRRKRKLSVNKDGAQKKITISLAVKPESKSASNSGA
jgi:protein phosphatase 4 regulatory subunit 3